MDRRAQCAFAKWRSWARSSWWRSKKIAWRMICVLSSRFRQFISNFIVGLVVPDISFLHFIYSFCSARWRSSHFFRSAALPVVASEKRKNNYISFSSSLSILMNASYIYIFRYSIGSGTYQQPACVHMPYVLKMLVHQLSLRMKNCQIVRIQRFV